MATGLDKSYGERELVRHLVANIPCAVCHHRYEPEHIRIVEHRGEVWVVAVACERCGTQGLVFAMIQEGEKAEVVSELASQEWARFREMPCIDADDILDVHEFLRDFDGDFVSLLEDIAG